jgi:hypothetical protein
LLVVALVIGLFAPMAAATGNESRRAASGQHATSTREASQRATLLAKGKKGKQEKRGKGRQHGKGKPGKHDQRGRGQQNGKGKNGKSGQGARGNENGKGKNARGKNGAQNGKQGKDKAGNNRKHDKKRKQQGKNTPAVTAETTVPAESAIPVDAVIDPVTTDPVTTDPVIDPVSDPVTPDPAQPEPDPDQSGPIEVAGAPSGVIPPIPPGQRPDNCCKPKAPSAVNAGPKSTTSILLVWQDNATVPTGTGTGQFFDPETGFEIHRRSPGGQLAKIASLPAHEGTGPMQYEDRGLAEGTRYCYVVKAVNKIGAAEASEACGATKLGAPTGLSVSAASATSLTIGWTDTAKAETAISCSARTTGERGKLSRAMAPCPGPPGTPTPV